MKSNGSRFFWLLVILLKESGITEGGKNNHMCKEHHRKTYNTMRLYDFQSMNGTITTRLSGTDYYGRHLKCRWYLDAGAFGRTKLTFTNVDLPRSWNSDGKCDEKDHVYIQNNYLGYEGYICADNYAEQFISYDRGTYITFQSGGEQASHKGVEIKYEMFDTRTKKCPPGWVIGPENVQRMYSCFHLMKAPNSLVNFETAQIFCGYSNANLVKIESREKHDFIKKLVSRSVTDFWIGLNDIRQEGTFVWIDRSPVSNFDVRRKPNDATKNCVIQEVASGVWKTVACEEHHYYVCEISSVYDEDVYKVPKRLAAKEEAGEMGIIGILACVGAALVVLVCCCYCCCCRKSNKNKNDPSTGQSQNTADEQATALNVIHPPPPVEPTAPPLSEFHPVEPHQSYTRGADGLPSYEECMGLKPPEP